VALEALSAYSIQTLNTASTNLTVRLGIPGRQKDYSITLTDTDEVIQKQLEVRSHPLFQASCSLNKRNIGSPSLAFLMLSNHNVLGYNFFIN